MTTHIMHKFSPVWRHMRQNLCSFFRIDKTKKGSSGNQTAVAVSSKRTYSANALSTTTKNLPFALAKFATSSPYIIIAFGCAFSLDSVLIPNASASLAFLFAIRQSLVHFKVGWLERVVAEDAVRPHVTDCLMRPQGHVRVTRDWQGSDSEQLEGA